MPDTKSDRGPYFWRNVIAYWILGLTNNYGYVIMLSAAHDIIANFSNKEMTITFSEVEQARSCHHLSTGAVLLADILPSLFIKIILPFVPFWTHLRVACAIILTIFSFVLVAFSTIEWMALFGVALTSLSAGLGETTFLSYSSKFNINVVSAWSSGTGGAGIIGSLSYAALRELGVSSRTSILIMLIVPILEGIAFWLILREPKMEKEPIINTADKNKIDDNDLDPPLRTIKEKIFYIPKVFRYMIPIALVYLLEYFINQGLFEFIYYRGIFMSLPSQYRWLNFDYQVGVFISRSSVNLIYFPRIWIMSVFQFVNMVIMLMEAIFFFIPYLWIIFAIVLWEGLLGGAAYVNTFYRISKEIPQSHLVFSMSFVSLSDTVAVATAGFLAMPVHNLICKLPEPKRI